MNHMDIHIESTRDHNMIATLNEGVQSLHHLMYPNDFKKFDLPSVSKWFEHQLNSANWYAYVANIDNRPIGYLLCQIRTRKENAFQYEKKLIHIDQIAVHKEFRQRGVGRKLVQQAFDLAEKMNVHEVQLDHWGKNQRAHAFFKQLGFAPFNLRMKKLC